MQMKCTRGIELTDQSMQEQWEEGRGHAANLWREGCTLRHDGQL